MLKVFHIGLCVQHRPFNGFQQAFIDILGEENYKEISCGESDLNRKCIEIYNSFKPDIIFMQIQAPNVISIETVKQFKNSKVINWTGDIRIETPKWMLDIAPYCISSFSNMRDVRYMLSCGFKSEYLEIGYDPLIYSPEAEKTACPEIVFMANNYEDQFPLGAFRKTTAKTLKSSFGNRFGVYGSGWINGSGNINHSQKEEAKYYRSAKIGINCSNFNVERYSSDRMLRILGSGCFCLSHKYSSMDYVDGEHIVTFENMNELVDKINYYIKNENERIRIATNGQQLVLNRNTFKHQVENIINL